MFSAAIALGVAIGEFGVLQAIQDRVDYADAWLAAADDADRQVAVVQVSEADYRGPFGGRSPLDAATLDTLIHAVLALNPAVVGVDIDTSPASFASLRTMPAGRVVWARDVDLRQSGQHLLPVLGFPGVEHEGVTGPPAGIALLEPDGDGIVRTYQRWRDTTFGARSSFACALVVACEAHDACGAVADDRAAKACATDTRDREARVIEYRYARGDDDSVLRLTAGDILGLAASPPGQRQTLASDLAGKVVIVGAAYRASGDTMHPTPLGPRDGVDLHAQIVATELRGGGARQTRMGATGILIAFQTYGVLLVARLRPWRRRLLIGSAIVLVVAMVASVVNDGGLVRVPFFAAVLLCVVALQLAAYVIERSQALLLQLFDGWRRRPQREE